LTLYNYFKWSFLYLPPKFVQEALPADASLDYPTELPQVDAVIVEVNASALNASHIFRFIEATDRLHGTQN
jgi:hypothetical protein